MNFVDPFGMDIIVSGYNGWLEPDDGEPPDYRYRMDGGGGYVPQWWYDIMNADPGPSYEEYMASKGYVYLENQYGIGMWFTILGQWKMSKDDAYRWLTSYENSPFSSEAIAGVRWEINRVDLTTCETPISDILTAIKRLNNEGLLNNLFDIIEPNNYANINDIDPRYSKYFTIDEYDYRLTVTGYVSSNHRSHYDIYKMGWGHLDYLSKYQRDNTYNSGYYTGFWMYGYEDHYLILIGGKSKQARKHLQKLYD